MYRLPRFLLVGLSVVILAAGCNTVTSAQPTGVDSGVFKSATTDSSGAPASGGEGQASAPPQLAAGWPSEAELQRARADVKKLSLPKLAAQLIVPRQQGQGAGAAAVMRTAGYGGLAVFAANIPSQRSKIVPTVRATNAAAAAAMRATGRTWPAFLAIDQEGGPVTRINAPLTQFPALMALGAADDPALATTVGKASGAELRALGFTVVMAPSADVTTPKDPTIGVRSAGSDPQRVARVVGGLIDGYNQAGILSTLKHFPGHGSVTADTHLGAARQSATLAQLRQRDLAPFTKLARQTPAVMVAHITAIALDRNAPATTSKAVVTGLLRQQLGFQGLVITDALDMQAITKKYPTGDAAVRVIQAGGDVLLMPDKPAAAAAGLVAAVNFKRLTRDRLEESAARMVAALRHTVTPSNGAAPGSQQQVAQQLAQRSITQISGTCGAKLVGSAIKISGGSAQDRALLNAAASAAGLKVGSGTAVTLLGSAGYRAGASAGSGSAIGTGDIVVALDRPYGLAASKARLAKIATYGRTPATFRALVQVLLGKQKATGALPVAVGTSKIGAGCT